MKKNALVEYTEQVTEDSWKRCIDSYDIGENETVLSLFNRIKKNHNATESQEQSALFAWAKRMEGQMPILALLHAIPNGGKRDARTGARMKREGVKPGVPDVFFPVARCGYHGLYIEMKVGKNDQTDNQIWWERELEHQGYRVVVARSWEKAMKLIIDYLNEKLMRGDL